MATTFKGNKNWSYGLLQATVTTPATQLTLQSGNSARFEQTGSIIGVIFGSSYTNPVDDSTAEIITMTHSSGELWTIVRSQESTSAKEWAAGSKVWGSIVTAGKIDELETVINQNETDIDTNTTNISTNTTNISTNTTNIATNTADIAALSFDREICIFEHKEGGGVHGGTSTSGTWNTVKLNTTIQNNITGASLSSYQPTLPAGTYVVDWWNHAWDGGSIQTRFTSSGPTIVGVSAYSASGVRDLHGRGLFTIGSSTTFTLQIYIATGVATYGMGRAASIGSEVYANIKIEKITLAS